MDELAFELEGRAQRAPVGDDDLQAGVEDVQDEPAPIHEVVEDRVERAELVLHGEEVDERPVGDHGEVEPPPKKLDPALGLRRELPHLVPGHSEHGRGPIEPHDLHPGLGDGDQDPRRAAPQLQHRRSRPPRLLDVEPHVPGTAGRVVVIERRILPVVFLHRTPLVPPAEPTIH